MGLQSVFHLRGARRIASGSAFLAFTCTHAPLPVYQVDT